MLYSALRQSALVQRIYECVTRLGREQVMTFDEILEQVVALLKRQRRTSYRALKMRFNLDDEYLAVLKEELIDAQGLASDEDGENPGMVWRCRRGINLSLPICSKSTAA